MDGFDINNRLYHNKYIGLKRLLTYNRIKGTEENITISSVYIQLPKIPTSTDKQKWGEWAL